MQRKTLRWKPNHSLGCSSPFIHISDIILPASCLFNRVTGLYDLDSLLISTGCLSVMKTSSGIMSLLGKPEWHWKNWRWTRRKTLTCASRELSLWVETQLHSNIPLFSLSESLIDLLKSRSLTQTKRTATVGTARGIALYEDEAIILFKHV